jgi:hypothetical protein
MIRIANINDLQPLAVMLRDLYKELMPDDALDDLRVYRLEIMKHLTDDRDIIYIEERGFFMVRDETEAMAPTLRRYNGIRVYIQPEHRHSSLLARFYKRLFTDFPDGDIMGITEIHSEHIKVLDKRHELVAKVYRMNRR